MLYCSEFVSFSQKLVWGFVCKEYYIEINETSHEADIKKSKI